MVTLPLPPCDAEKIKARLYDEFRIEIPVVVWRNQPHVRVSIQAYNARDGIERLGEALQKLLQKK